MVKVIVLKKKRGSSGQPMFDVYIENTNSKISGLRKLKGSNMYSIQSYGGKQLKDNLEFYLKKKVTLSGDF